MGTTDAVYNVKLFSGHLMVVSDDTVPWAVGAGSVADEVEAGGGSPVL